MPPHKGFTIHSGFFPQLISGRPSRKWSTTRSPKGITIKGYNRAFIEQIRSLSQQRRQQLMDPAAVVMTQFGSNPQAWQTRLQAAASVIGRRPPFMEQRAVSWRDVAGSFTEYNRRTRAFTIRGQYSWYMLGSTGPKEMAQRIVNEPSFNIQDAENWYTRDIVAQGRQGAQAQVTWAQQALGLHPNNIKDTISKEDIEHIGDTAEEVVFTESSDKETVFSNKQTPENPTGRYRHVHGRDLDTEYGPMESTEELGTRGHHGLPDNYMETAFQGQAPTEQAWENFMRNTVLRKWNQFAAEVLESEAQPGETPRDTAPRAAAWVGSQPAASSASYAVNAGLEMSLQELRKMRHEFTQGNLNSSALDFGATWREGIPITDRAADGTRTYASSQLRLTEEMQFELEDVIFVRGLNHSLAFNSYYRNVGNNASYYVTQQDHFAHARMNNSSTARSVNGVTRQGFDAATASVREKINVSFSIEDGERWLDEVTKEILADVKKKARDRNTKIHSQLEQRARNHQDIFWALPYISIEEGLYRG